MNLKTIVLLCFLKHHTDADRNFPLNSAVVVGRTVTFNCRTNAKNSIIWKHTTGQTNVVENILFDDGNFTEHCENCNLNRTERGQFDLIISSVKLTQAGKYKCMHVHAYTYNSNQSSYSAELIVLDSPPKCDTNLTKANGSVPRNIRSVLMWCVIEFRGNLAPVMEWKNERTGKIIPSTFITHANSKADSEIIAGVYANDVISCTTFFSQSTSSGDPSSYDTPAKNIPDYRYTWTFNLSIYIRRDSETERTNSIIDVTIDELTEGNAENSPYPPYIMVLIFVLSFGFGSLVSTLMFLLLIKFQRGCFDKAPENAESATEATDQDPNEKQHQTTPSGSNMQQSMGPPIASPLYENLSCEGSKYDLEAEAQQNDSATPVSEYENTKERAIQLSAESAIYYNSRIPDPNYQQLCENPSQQPTVYAPLRFQ